MTANLDALSKKLRKRIIEIGFIAGKDGAHFGSSLSLVEIVIFIYEILVNKKLIQEKNEKRDRVILSKGHGALGLFVYLEHIGALSKEQIETFNSNGTYFFSHAHKDLNNSIEYSGGSLGLGLPFGIGIALSNRSKKIDSKVVVILGDGECDEGIVWEAFMTAAHQQLENLIVIVDQNGFQSDGEKSKILDHISLTKKIESFGFEVISVNGNNIDDLASGFKKIEPSKKPKAIVARTTKGKGVDFMESNPDWHYGIINESILSDAVKSIEDE